MYLHQRVFTLFFFKHIHTFDASAKKRHALNFQPHLQLSLKVHPAPTSLLHRALSCLVLSGHGHAKDFSFGVYLLFGFSYLQQETEQKQWLNETPGKCQLKYQDQPPNFSKILMIDKYFSGDSGDRFVVIFPSLSTFLRLWIWVGNKILSFRKPKVSQTPPKLQRIEVEVSVALVFVCVLNMYLFPVVSNGV